MDWFSRNWHKESFFLTNGSTAGAQNNQAKDQNFQDTTKAFARFFFFFFSTNGSPYVIIKNDFYFI